MAMKRRDVIWLMNNWPINGDSKTVTVARVVAGIVTCNMPADNCFVARTWPIYQIKHWPSLEAQSRDCTRDCNSRTCFNRSGNP